MALFDQDDRDADQAAGLVHMSLATAQEKLHTLPDFFSKQSGPAVVVHKGKRVLVLMTWKEYESLMETLEILSDPELMKSLRESIQEMNEGKIIDWKDVRIDRSQ